MLNINYTPLCIWELVFFHNEHDAHVSMLLKFGTGIGERARRTGKKNENKTELEP